MMGYKQRKHGLAVNYVHLSKASARAAAIGCEGVERVAVKYVEVVE